MTLEPKDAALKLNRLQQNQQNTEHFFSLRIHLCVYTNLSKATLKRKIIISFESQIKTEKKKQGKEE